MLANVINNSEKDADNSGDASGASQALLSVCDLRVGFKRPGSQTLYAVDNVAFETQQGETLAVVGESGSGKSVTMLSIMRLIDAEMSGAVRFRASDERAHDLLKATSRELQSIRGGEIAMIFQDSNAALDPLVTIGEQVAETVRVHEKMGRRAAWRKAVELLERVGIAGAEHRAHNYPHQLSGGMRQRVMIAAALAGNPKLLIADEPTTALDVTIQAQILDLLRNIQTENELAIILVTHDLGVVSEVADRVVVMYAGQIVESGDAKDVLTGPRHPYSAALLACLPRLNGKFETLEARFRRALPGIVPAIDENFVGCRFRTRCQLAREKCNENVPLIETTMGWRSRCFFWDEAS